MCHENKGTTGTHIIILAVNRQSPTHRVFIFLYTLYTHTANCPHLTVGLLAETGNTHKHTHEIDGVPCTLYLLASPGWRAHIDTGNYTSPLGLTSATLEMSVTRTFFHPCHELLKIRSHGAIFSVTPRSTVEIIGP